MPYGVRKQGSKCATINKDTGKVCGTHATKAKAQAQVRAMYANAKGK